jgi:hypothetical protein
MPLKSFVDNARRTNALMEKLKLEQKNSEKDLIDISDGQSIPKEKLEKIKEDNFNHNNNLNGEFNYNSQNQNYKNNLTNNKNLNCNHKNNSNYNKISTNYNSSNNNFINKPKNYTSFEKNYIKKDEPNFFAPKNNSQKIDERHNNIIVDIIKKSESSGNGNTTWENCKYKKDCDGTIYCREFMSLCGKEKCNRATK